MDPKDTVLEGPWVDDNILFKPQCLDAMTRKLSLKMSKLGGGDVCHRCTKAVYQNEKMSHAGLNYHKVCFICKGLAAFNQNATAD